LESKQCGGIDLHIHSTASDGTFSPSEILQLAAQAGLQAISITDHDTLDGSRQALQCDIAPGLRFVTGVEISAQPPIECQAIGSLHILGYGVDPDHAELVETLRRFQQVREARTHQMLARLNALGIALTMEQVMAEVGEGAPSRPHVASAMVKAGIVPDIETAFQNYLGKGRPAYVTKERLDCRQAFELILASGGVPVLAHPYLIQCQQADGWSNLLQTLCALGLKGIEVYYPKHPPEAVLHYQVMAEKFGLLATGGSDFHGALTPEIEIGRGTGNLHVPYDLFEKMISVFGLKHIR
jgi:predicted metal-dependent phosphoesterase TrpH